MELKDIFDKIMLKISVVEAENTSLKFKLRRYKVEDYKNFNVHYKINFKSEQRQTYMRARHLFEIYMSIDFIDIVKITKPYDYRDKDVKYKKKHF